MTRALLAALALAAILAGVQTWRIDRLKAELDAAKDQASALAQQLDVAGLSAQKADDRCEAAVTAARQSARAIERIIERPVHVDSEGCAVRELIAADELREAVQPGAVAP